MMSYGGVQYARRKCFAEHVIRCPTGNEEVSRELVSFLTLITKVYTTSLEEILVSFAVVIIVRN